MRGWWVGGEVVREVEEQVGEVEGVSCRGEVDEGRGTCRGDRGQQRTVHIR